MLSIIRRKRNANQNHSENFTLTRMLIIQMTDTGTDETVEKLEPSYTADRM